ncbi:hypothetical protein H3S87_02490 [Bifidobacterium sp. W8108]|uniref:hypothetical protein n=1 Tax=unclassified Bifidobacterium TaxID=2608897 RepID=UPI0018DDF7DC|nr:MULTISPECIES: hypothetical protein [unclassified Bifidobacterium]MBH9978536.1 hypothetical protein [Bifidobacterium sp. W8108]MBI0173594.1 hypothetical protein [Bifidobacterium sp. M0307]
MVIAWQTLEFRRFLFDKSTTGRAFPIIVVQEVARSSRVSHTTSNPYSRQGSRGFTICSKCTIQIVLACQVCAIRGKKLATDFVLALQIPHLALPGPIPDGGDIRFHLPVQSGQAFAFLSGQSLLVFLVDDLVLDALQAYADLLIVAEQIPSTCLCFVLLETLGPESK